jgi:hypothetical protein
MHEGIMREIRIHSQRVIAERKDTEKYQLEHRKRAT